MVDKIGIFLLEDVESKKQFSIFRNTNIVGKTWITIQGSFKNWVGRNWKL